MKLRTIIALVICLAAAGSSKAIDTIVTTDGQSFGKVKDMNRYEVIVFRNGLDTKVAVNEIVSISYEGEPASMKTVRGYVEDIRYADALEKLDTIVVDADTSLRVKQDIQFYRALCNARRAQAGTGDIKEAGREMFNFVKSKDGIDNSKSYHYLQACEVLGDMLVADGKYDVAAEYYKEVADAPWPDYKMRAGVAIGNALLKQGKIAEAKAAFEEVVDNREGGELALLQKRAAAVGQARCMALEGQDKEAIELLTLKVIAYTRPDEIELNAQAYNALGAVHRKAGRTKEALLAFLHTDILYSAASDAHAEALYNLAQLWKQLPVPNAERAIEAEDTLRRRYTNSSWTKKLN